MKSETEKTVIEKDRERGGERRGDRERDGTIKRGRYDRPREIM